MERPRSAAGWRQLRRRISNLKGPQQSLPGETSTDGDYVVLREIREKRLAEKKSKKYAVSALNENFVANNLRSAPKLGGRPGTVYEDAVAVVSSVDEETKQKLLNEIKADHVDRVRAILGELSKRGITGAEDDMRTAQRMNILHVAIEHEAKSTTQYLILHGHPDLLSQEFDVFVKGNVSQRNTLHLLTLKNNLESAKSFLARMDDGEVKHKLMYSETAMEIVGQRPRTFTCLHIAAFQGSVPFVELFLKGVHVNHLNSKQDSALLWAARWGHTDVMRTLINKGAKANIGNDKDSTALYWAVRYNHPEAVELLTTIGKANVNQVRKVGLVAPIILAAALGYADIVRILLDGGADANMEIRGGETPLMQAAREGHVDVAEVLLEYQAVVDKHDERGDTPLTLATKFNNPAVVDVLLKAGAKISHKNHEGLGAWHYAISSEDNDTLITLVRFLQENSSASPGTKQLSRKPPLCIAASLGQCDKIKFLISVGLDPSETDLAGNNLLHHAAINDYEMVLKTFHQQVGIDLQNKAGDSPLHIACLHGHSECISVLLGCKAKANIKNCRGDTALHIMARSPHTQPSSVALLMDYMIKTHAWDSLHVQDLNGNSALHEAAAHASCEVLWEFRGLSFKQKNEDGNTPLHIAVRQEHPEVLNTMLEIFDSMKRDADINERNNKRETVLHLAALSGFTSTTRNLVQFGADIAARDQDGNTVFHTLTIAIANDPENAKQFLDVMDVLFDELVRWWCLSNEVIYPDDDPNQYRRIKRKAVHLITEDETNYNDLSVLTLAAKFGVKRVLEKILMMPFVNFVQKDDKAFLDITHLTPQTDGKSVEEDQPKTPAAVSCMEWLVNMDDPHKAGRTFDVPALRQVEKIYGGICAWTYIILMFFHLLYMGAFSGLAVTALREARDNTASASLLTAMYVIVLLEPSFILLYMCYLFFRFITRGGFSRQSQIMKSQQRIAAFVEMLGSYWPLIFSNLYSLLVITWVILYYYQYKYHDYFLAVSILFGWLFSIFFTRGFKAVNYFWNMLKLMIVRDVSRFLFIYIFILLAFSFAFHVLLQVSDDVASLYPNALDTIFTTFNTMVGMDWLFEGELQEKLSLAGRSSVPLKVFHIFHVALTTIILLNVLIAMMNDSYQDIRLNQTVTWRVDAVRLGLEIETMLPFTTSWFNRIKIIQGDILQMLQGASGQGRDSPEEIEDGKTSSRRWYVEIPLFLVSYDGDVSEADVSRQVAALSRRVEALEERLVDALQETRDTMRDLQERITPKT